MGDFVDIFDREYLSKLGIRAHTFRAVVREAVSRDVKNIVETGCTRKKDNWEGDGQSTIIWSKFTGYHQGSFATIDIDAEAIDMARELTGGQASWYVCGDSVKELRTNFSNSPIDLLYLDSFDVDMTNAAPAAMHCLFEFCSAKPRLKSGSIVFIDDSPMGPNFEVGGKGAFVANYFKQLGVPPFTMGYQIAWIMP